MLSDFLEKEIRKLEKEYDVNIDIDEMEDIQMSNLLIEDNKSDCNTVVAIDLNLNDKKNLYILKKKLAYFLTAVEIENNKLDKQLEHLKEVR